MIKDSSEDSFEIFLKETRLLFCRPDEDFSGFFCLLLGYANYKKKTKEKERIITPPPGVVEASGTSPSEEF